MNWLALTGSMNLPLLPASLGWMCYYSQSFAVWAAVGPRRFGHLFWLQHSQGQFAMVSQLLSVVAFVALGCHFAGMEVEIWVAF